MTKTTKEVLTWNDCIAAKSDFEANLQTGRQSVAQHGLLSQQSGVVKEKQRADQTLMRIHALEQQVATYMADKNHLLVANQELTPDTLPLAYAVQSFYTSSLQALSMILENFINVR